MNRMILGLAGMMAAGAFLPAAAQAQDWRGDGYYQNHDRHWRGDNGRHRGWDRGWDRGHGWNRGPKWRRICEWRGHYRPRRVCYRVRGW
ncbi:hypothetical protein [uncultured Sphingomonas sp.]|uniref:hypothetical protein n=1 Tax=uncultured Sphingomonas sp. TaxID=158754 RepID=UPI0026033926|nr:hypothetical protein [uncultured Sphingomonas sp.]